MNTTIAVVAKTKPIFPAHLAIIVPVSFANEPPSRKDFPALIKNPFRPFGCFCCFSMDFTVAQRWYVFTMEVGWENKDGFLCHSCSSWRGQRTLLAPTVTTDANGGCTDQQTCLPRPTVRLTSMRRNPYIKTNTRVQVLPGHLAPSAIWRRD